MADDGHRDKGHLPPDPIQQNLNAVSKRLAFPAFLKNLTPSRLPSQAASDTSHSPGEAPHKDSRSSFAVFHHTQHHLEPLSPVSRELTRLSDVEEIALTAPLIFHPSDDGAIPVIEEYVRDELESRFLEAHRAYTKMATERGFQTFSHGHQDLVLATDFNYFGNRMVTASSDHRLKVWDRKDDSWTLVDSWRAHDAEIVDVKWNGPFMGEVVGSIGEDGRFKLWQEEVSEVPLSGRRFKLITNIASQTNAPFMSLDFKNIMQETWLALITRDGRLSIYEPVDQSSLNEWTLLAEHWVCENNPPERHEEVGFKVCFHKEKLPCWTAVMAGLDRKALSLAVSAMQSVLVFRTDKAKRFYLAAELKGARQIIRDIDWANGSMRGYDVIATASKDGAIRIYELSTPRPDSSTASNEAANPSTAVTDPISPRPSGPRKNAPSGIGAGLAGVSRQPESGHEHEQHPGRVKHKVKMVSELTQHHSAVWRVRFSQMGDLLVSTGDDAAIRIWKKAISGGWLEYAEIDSTHDH